MITPPDAVTYVPEEQHGCERSIEETRSRIAPMRLLAEQVFSRTAGAPLVPGNRIRLLKDARENYPAWLEAMRSAAQNIHFENFIIHDDDCRPGVR